MPIASIIVFFNEIIRDLHTSLYLALGGSADEESIDWSSQAVELVSTGIKILLLLLVLGLLYWLAIYLIKKSSAKIRLNDRRIKILRSVLRYIWIVASLIAIMSQINFEPETIKATAKASTWAGIYYVLWTSSGQIIHRILQHYGLNASIEQLLKNVLSVLLLVLGLASVMAQFGFDIVSLVAGLGIAGLAVGFAAQSTLANFIAGITILLEQSFQVGDWVHINENEGRVVVIALRTTHVLTRDNITVIIPNSKVASSEVTNITSKTSYALTFMYVLLLRMISQPLAKRSCKCFLIPMWYSAVPKAPLPSMKLVNTAYFLLCVSGSNQRLLPVCQSSKKASLKISNLPLMLQASQHPTLICAYSCQKMSTILLPQNLLQRRRRGYLVRWL